MRGLVGTWVAWRVLLAGNRLGAQVLSPEESAAILLNGARSAYNQGNFAVAIDRFREYLQKYPTFKGAASAGYGLGLSLLESPQRNYEAAIQALEPVASITDFPDRAYALYYLGKAHRGVAAGLVARAAAEPAQGQQLQGAAQQRWQQAAAAFASAAEAFTALVKNPAPADAKGLPLELEWACRARCDQAETLLRLGRAKEAMTAVEPLMKDPVLSKSRYRAEATYFSGYASYLLKDYPAAVRALASLAPFEDSQIGIHARYLLARVHHQADQPGEAMGLYEAVQAGYQRQRKAAQEALKNAEALKGRPEERTRLEGIVAGPPPDYVAKAGFYWGVLLYEQARWAEALAKFNEFLQQSPRSALAPEAQLRRGMCHAQLRQHNEATAVLTPLQEHPALGDQALRWLARVQIGAADPTNLQASEQAARGAIEKLQRSAERLKTIINDSKLLAADPQAKSRRGEVLLELGDAQRLARQYKEAAQTYQLIISENTAPEAVEEALHGLATALQLGGMFKESDQACLQFQKRFPQSTLLPAVMFRYAENAYLAAAQSGSTLPAEQLRQLYGEAIKRYQELIARYPAFEHLSLARQGMASAYYQIGQYDKAAEALQSIPEVERSGPLASVNYVLADCLLRTLPPEGDDALSTARLLGQLEQAEALLTGVMMTEGSPLQPDATIKLGYTLQRIAALTADPEERNKVLQKARSSYARFMLPRRDHPLYPLAVLEDAKVLEMLGGFAAAVRELQRFQSDPLRKSPLATLAILRLAEGMRGQNRAKEAAALLTLWRQEREAELLKDPAKAEWVAALQFGQAMALKDAGRFAEALPIFQNVLKQFPSSVEAAEVPLRVAQCRREEANLAIEQARKLLAAAATTPEKIQEARTAIAQGLKSLESTAAMFIEEAGRLEGKPERLETRLRMLYEAAWCYRWIAEEQIDAAMEQLRAEGLKKLQERMPKEGSYPPPRAPEVAVASVPLQPAEQKARQLYEKIIASGADTQIAMDARYELAEMMANRNEHGQAITLLAGALETSLPTRLEERIRLRLGACYLAQGQGGPALEQFNVILKAPRSPLIASARYGAGEAAAMLKDWNQAIQFLLPFRDGDLYRHLPGTSDRAMVRLAYAFAELKQWEESRRTFEAVASRFPRSAWVPEAKFGMGWALENQKQYDAAIAAYKEVTNLSGAEIAAKAQVRIGLCRMEQKRPGEAVTAFLAVPYTYDYPETSALAMCEAAKAYLELKQPVEATRLLEKVLQQYASSSWAEVARKRLAEIKGG